MKIPAKVRWCSQLLWVTLIVSTPGTAHAADSADESTTLRRNAPATLRSAEPAVTPTLANRVMLDWQVPVETIKVLDLDGRDVTDEARPEMVNGHIAVATQLQRQLVFKTREIKTVKARANEVMTLPGGVAVAERTGGAGGAPPASWLRLTLLASPTPADWDAVAGGYFTRVTFGLKKPDDAGDLEELERPITIKLGFEGLIATEIPTLMIAAPGLEHEKTVDLHFVPRTPHPKLLIRSTISDADLELEALPRLDVVPANDRVLGLGLGVVNVTVTHLRPHGEIVAATEPTNILVKVEGGGAAQPGVITLNPGEASSSFSLRSAGLGPLRVRASAGGVSGATIVEQRLFGPLFAALVGGALGGYARRFVRGSRRKLIARRVIEGMVVGLVAFVAGALGVGYLSLPVMIVTTEAGAFLTGVLAGFVGVSVLEMLTKKMRPISA